MVRVVIDFQEFLLGGAHLRPEFVLSSASLCILAIAFKFNNDNFEIEDKIINT